MPGGGFEPGCVDLTPATAVAPEGDPLLDDAGLLGAEPVVQFPLPTIRVGDVTDFSRPSLWRIPGGMLVELRPYNDGALPVGALVAIDADGDVRWRRCFARPPDLVATAQSASAEELVVGWTTWGAAGPSGTELEVWSLADGRPSRTWDELLAANGISGAATEHRANLLWGSDLPMLVFGPQGDRPATADDTLLVLDLATMVMRELPYPAGAVGEPVNMVRLELGADGRVVAFDPLVYRRAIAVATADGWSTDSADIDRAVGVRVAFDGPGVQLELNGIDSQGEELWRRSDILAPPFEGFHSAVDGDMAIAAGCAAVDMNLEVPCTGWGLWGLDLRTGATRWVREGRFAVTGFGSGVAMVAGPFTDGSGEFLTDWTMIDLATGQQVGERSWTEPWSFGVGCCDEPARVYRSGGVVFTVDREKVEMWYPEAQTTPLRVVPFG